MSSKKKSKSNRARKLAAPHKTESAHRPLETIRAEIRKVMDGPLKQQHARLSALNAEFGLHPEGKHERAERDAALKAEDRALQAERRKREANFPRALNPLTDNQFGQSLHNVVCAFDYYRTLIPENEQDNTKLSRDQVFGRYMLGMVFDSALETLEKQYAFERKETRDSHAAELAKLKGGAT